MEPEQQQNNTPEEVVETPPENNLKTQFTTVTPLSKYLAMALFIILPIVGIWVGYKYAQSQVFETDYIVDVEYTSIDSDREEDNSWVTFSNSDDVYKITYPASWEVETETFYNFERLKLVNPSSDGNKIVFNVGFVANPRYLDKFGNVGGRQATYGEFSLCLNEGGQGPDCILTIVNVPLTSEETEQVRTDTSTDNEWNLEVTYGVSTEEVFSVRNDEVYLNLKEFYKEQEPLLRRVLDSIEFVDNKEYSHLRTVSEENVNSGETKTYKNSQYDFTIKYPSELIIEENTSDRGDRLLGVLFHENDRLEPKIQLNIFPREKLFVGTDDPNLNLDSIYEKMNQAGLNYEKVTINGIEGFRSNMFNEGTHEQIILTDESYYYDIRVVREIDSRSLFDDNSYTGEPSSNIWE